MKIEGMLKGHDLFRSLSVEDVDKISSFSAVKKFEKGETIHRHNTPATHVFLNLEGMVQLEIPARSPEVRTVISEVPKGELFGLAPILENDRYTATAKAMEPTSVLAIEAKPLRDALQSNPVLGLHFMSRVARAYFDRYVSVSAKLQAVLNQIL